MPQVQQDIALDRKLAQATELISDGHYRQALPLCELILKTAPHEVVALNNAAIAYLKLGHVETAISYLNKALHFDPSHEESFYNLINLQLKRGETIRAALTFHAHHRHIPNSPQKKDLVHHLWPPPLPEALLDDDGALNPRPIRQIHTNWGDSKRGATLSFLHKTLERAAQASTGILACGGGLTTLFLAQLAAQQDLDVWVLEHQSKWYDYICALLERQSLEDAVHVCHAPLYDYGACIGYDVPSALPDAFGLVVCGRLSTSVNGNRYGFSPILYDHLEAACTLLLDDVSPIKEAEMLTRWKDEGHFDIEIIHDDTPFAVLSRSTVPPSAVPAPPAQQRALPLNTKGLLEYLRQHPRHEKVFHLLINRCVEAGDDKQAADLFETFEANIRESASKQALRSTLFDYTIDLEVDHPGPICIGGCGSSGTNLLRRLLDAHSQIACGKEMSVFDRPHIYRMSLDELRTIYLSGSFSSLDEEMPVSLTGEGNASYCGLEPGNHGDYYHTPADVLDLFDRAESVADFFDKYFLSFAQERGKYIWAEKTPNNIFCVSDFLEMYPEGRFIQMIRDGRDVCISLATRRDYAPAEAMARWNMAVEAGLRVTDHDRVYTVRYEELVVQPEETLEALFEWLHLPYEETVLQFNRKNEKNAHGYAESSIHTQSAFRWKKTWSKLPVRGRRQLDLGLTQHLIATGYKG